MGASSFDKWGTKDISKNERVEECNATIYLIFSMLQTIILKTNQGIKYFDQSPHWPTDPLLHFLQFPHDLQSIGFEPFLCCEFWL